MSDILWWFGAIHLAVYALAGSAFVITIVASRALKQMGWYKPFVQWMFEQAKAKRKGIPG